METDELINKIKRWGAVHGITNPQLQLCKVVEETGEIAHEVTRNNLDSPEIIDALGDTTVTIIILADILGYDIRDCLASAYEEIKDRNGITVNGTFIKRQS